MLVLSQTFPVVCSIKQAFVWKNSVRDLSTKHEKTTSQKGEEWDKVRAGLAQELGLEFQPEKLQELAFNFY